MVKIPAFCTKCGHVFLLPNFVGGAHTFGSFGNFTRCPHCGGRAAIAEGLFRIENDELSIIKAPPLTHALVEQVRKYLARAKAEQASNDEIIAELGVVAPALAMALRPYAKSKTTAVLLLIILAVLNACTLEMKVDLNRLVDQVAAAWDDPNLAASQSTAPKPPEAQPQTEPVKPKVSRQQRRYQERQEKKTR